MRAMVALLLAVLGAALPSAEGVRQAFNAHSRDVRLVALISPT